MAKKKVKDFSTQELTFLLTAALSKIMDWMPFENYSKAILIPDPRDETQLCAIHNGHDGITILVDEGYQGFIEEILCKDCQSKLEPYSVIYTGFDVETGEYDPEAFVGLYGAHDEDIDSINHDDNEEDESEVQLDDLSTKRILN